MLGRTRLAQPRPAHRGPTCTWRPGPFVRALVNWAQQQSIIALSQVPTDTLGWACRTVGVCHQVLQCVVGLDAESKYTAGPRLSRVLRCRRAHCPIEQHCGGTWAGRPTSESNVPLPTLLACFFSSLYFNSQTLEGFPHREERNIPKPSGPYLSLWKALASATV